MDWIKKNKFTCGLIVSIVLLFLISALANTSKNDSVNNKPAQQASTPTPPQTPKPDYELIGTDDLTYLRQERHFVWNKDKPDETKTKEVMLELKKTCPSGKICDFMLWDSESAYKSRDNTSNLSTEYSVNNKEHLIGYLNSGGLFYYYGAGEVYLSE